MEQLQPFALLEEFMPCVFTLRIEGSHYLFPLFVVLVSLKPPVPAIAFGLGGLFGL